MENNDRKELVKEYVNRLNKLKYLSVRHSSYSRFSIKDNTFVKKSNKSVIYSACVVIIMNLILIHLVYETMVIDKYLLYTELIILLELSLIISLFILNIIFSNRRGIPKLINYSIDIDIFLGKDDTQFMRDIIDRFYLIISFPVLMTQITITSLMYFTFKVSMAVHVTGTILFMWLLGAFYDIDYLICNACFLSLRARYLNVALMKYLNIKTDCMPSLGLFDGMFWEKKHDDLVNFHKKANVKLFVNAYKMLYDYKDIFQQCYRFLIFVGVMCVTIGSLFSIQTVIIYGRTGMDMMRQSVMVGWLVVSYIFVFTIFVSINIFSRLMDQTKLICTFAQLKSITNERIYRSTKAILRATEIRVDKVLIYGVFAVDPGVLLKICASTFVYLTAQLQLTLPKGETDIVINATTTVATF